MMEPRHEALIELLDQFELDALLILSSPNLRYLSGFTGTDGALIVTRDRVLFSTDSRYTTQARQQVSADRIQQYTAKNEGIVGALKECKAHRVGFESEFLSVGELNRLEAAAEGGLQWVGVGQELKKIRLVKSSSEIDALAQTAALHQTAFSAVQDMLRPGVRELDVALELEFSLRRAGAEEKAFDYIVASGLRGAMPHGVASEKLIEADELVTIDFGARRAGYHSDETITVAVGQVSEKLRSIFDIVLEAHDRAIAAVKPGACLKDIDRIARDYIAEKGYGDYFGHGLGHGVGLEIHEQPVVSQKADLTALENMVFTIEPGIYIEGLGGVRIEDTVVVTSNGCRCLTVLPKEFRQFPA